MNALRRLRAWITWQRVPVSNMLIKQPGAEVLTALAYTVFYVFAAGIISLIVARWPVPMLGSVSFTADAWYALLFKIGLLLIVPGVWFFKKGYRVSDLLPAWQFRFKTAMSIVIALLIGLCLNLGKIDLISDALAGRSAMDAFLRVGMGLVLSFLMAGLPEEFVYRGILQTRLERALGRIPAIIITVLLFTAWHLPSRFLLAHGVEGSAGDFTSVLIGTGLPVSILALIFSLGWDRYRSLLPLIALHWGIDIIPTIASFSGVTY